MIKIPIKAAKEIAAQYGYDQVVIYARKVDGYSKDGVHLLDGTGGECITTYGTNKAHCSVAVDMAAKLMLLMGWKSS